MVRKIYAVQDVKAVYFLPPICLKSDGEAKRFFSDAVNDKQTVVGVHPEDFRLYNLGEFDDNSGKITAVEPLFLANGVDFVKVFSKGEVSDGGKSAGSSS